MPPWNMTEHSLTSASSLIDCTSTFLCTISKKPRKQKHTKKQDQLQIQVQAALYLCNFVTQNKCS